jgi:hypothetical protein
VGKRPEDLQAALKEARERLAELPKLIPVYSHRFLPSDSCEPSNPVLSVYQTDVIYYGFDLASYFAKEFKVPSPAWAATEARQVSFWSMLADL